MSLSGPASTRFVVTTVSMSTEPIAAGVYAKLRLAFIGAVLLLMGTGATSQYCLKRSKDDAVWVAHTYQVLRELQGLSSAVHMAQRDERAYLLTADPKLLVRLHAEWSRIAARMTILGTLTVDNAVQQQRLARLQVLLNECRAAQGRNLRTAGKDRQKAVLEYALSSTREEQRMSKVEDYFFQLREDEDGLLQARSRFWQNSSEIAAVLVGAATILGTLLIVLSGLWIRHDLRRREKAEATLRQFQEELEARVEERTADLSRTTASLESEIADRRKTEERLGESEWRYRMLFDDNPLPMEIFDPETLAFLAVNKAAIELYGYSAQEFQHMTLRDTRPPEELPSLLEFLETVKTAEAYSGTFVTLHKNGNLINIEARVRTIEFGGRKARLKLVTDVTEHKRLETQLRQSQKIEAVGRLAGGIAHDFNNLLTVILGYSDSILRTIDPSDRIGEKVLEIQAAGQRAANLTKQLLAFSRKQILQPQVLELNTLVSNISHMLGRLLGEDVRISLHLDAGLGQIRADPTQLEQVLVNLAVNARDAMLHGGQLVIETRNIELDHPGAVLQGVPPGRYVLLVLSDTGCGMSEEVKARVFEPFFTTKEVGKGTGLGLSMVLGVVQQSGGTVTIYSELGVGTTFRIYLPRLDAPVTQTAEPEAPHHPPAVKGATILLVEDEPSLRALAREVLQESGYVVIEAGNGKEALKVVEDITVQPALLLTDVVMPEMSGLELAEELRRRRPDVAVIYTSGYTDHALLERNTLREDMPFLQKPYMPASLLELVAKVLENKRPEPPGAPQDGGQRQVVEMAGTLS